jgi:hypothetical protein
MTKQILFSLLALLLYFAGLAQTEAPPAILVSSGGKLTYRTLNSKKQQKLVDGAVLKNTGTIRLKKRSSALLLSNGNLVQVSTKGKYPLTELFPQGQDETQRLNFDVTFSDYLMSAVLLAADSGNSGDAWSGIRTSTGSGDGWGGIRTSTGSGDGWGGIRTSTGSGDGWGGIRTSTGSGDGWGGQGTKIFAIQPMGKILPKATVFRWSRPAGNPTYRLQLKDENGQVLLETSTRDTAFTVDLSQAVFSGAGRIEWQVAAEGSGGAVSNPLLFAFATPEDIAAALAPAKAAPTYANATPTVQQLMEATALERKDFFDAAAQRYQDVQRTDARSEMVRLMHAAFWLRHGMKSMATAVYKG